MESKKRILVFSDAHFSVNTKIEEARWWSPLEKILPEKISNKYLRRIDKLTQECLYEMIIQASRLEPIDYLLDLGDSTPGTSQRGIITDKAIRERLEYQEIIDAFFPGVEKRFLWGNHDVGFYNKNSSIFSLGSQVGGMSRKSYLLAEGIIGLPWQSFKLGKFTFLLLNSEIVKASSRKSSALIDRLFFKEKERGQRKFIENVLGRSSDQVILAIHDPSTLKSLLPVLKEHQDRICLTLAGHYHILDSWQVRRVYRKLPEWIKLKIVPNTWGGIFENKKIFGGKGGFAILDLSDNSCELEYHWL